MMAAGIGFHARDQLKRSVLLMNRIAPEGTDRMPAISFVEFHVRIRSGNAIVPFFSHKPSRPVRRPRLNVL
jgi:hypothetical protein